MSVKVEIREDADYGYLVYSQTDGSYWELQAFCFTLWGARWKAMTIADFIENEAHARLFAASPDLLEACKEALLWYGPDGDHISDPARALLLNAIAKAESHS